MNCYNVDSFVVWFPIEIIFIIYVNTKLNSGTTAYTIPEACFSNSDLLDQNEDPDINK